MTRDFKVIEVYGVLEKDYGEQLCQNILEFATEAVDGILLDLGQVSFMNSIGLGYLASTYTTLKKMGKELYLCSLNEQLKIIFELTSMDSCFKIYPDRESFNQAINSQDQ